jgi:hypothetical protein
MRKNKYKITNNMLYNYNNKITYIWRCEDNHLFRYNKEKVKFCHICKKRMALVEKK